MGCALDKPGTASRAGRATRGTRPDLRAGSGGEAFGAADCLTDSHFNHEHSLLIHSSTHTPFFLGLTSRTESPPSPASSFSSSPVISNYSSLEARQTAAAKRLTGSIGRQAGPAPITAITAITLPSGAPTRHGPGHVFTRRCRIPFHSACA